MTWWTRLWDQDVQITLWWLPTLKDEDVLWYAFDVVLADHAMMSWGLDEPMPTWGHQYNNIWRPGIHKPQWIWGSFLSWCSGTLQVRTLLLASFHILNFNGRRCFLWMPGIHKPVMWFLSFGQLFGWSRRVGLIVRKESPTLGILVFWYDLGGSFCQYPLCGWTYDTWHSALLAQMIVLITCCNG